MLNLNFVCQVGPMKWATRYMHLQFNKRVLKRDLRLKLPTGPNIILPRQSQSASEVYVTNADIDWGAEHLFSLYAEKNRDFLDIGAHIGYYSTYLSPLVRRVFAFEPDPRNIPSLKVNAALCGNILVVEKPVSARSGSVFLSVNGSSATSHLLNEESDSCVELQSISIDEYVNLYHGIDVGLIKTDVEGHDLQVLIGAQKTISKYNPIILTECELNMGLNDFMNKLNYCAFAFVRDKLWQKARFENIIYNSLPHKNIKMIFLVPQHLVHEFLSRTTVFA